MKTLLVLAALFVGANANARINTQDLTAFQAKAIVAQAGAIVLSTSEYGFDLFVSSARFCAAGETTAPAYVPTLDSDAAFIGYTCAVGANDDKNTASVYPRNYAVCQEGARELTLEDQGRDSQKPVYKVCLAGKWQNVFARDNNPPSNANLVCQEGATEIVSEDSGRDSQRNVTYVCHAGNWYKKY